jgi:hypothetical protein
MLGVCNWLLGCYSISLDPGATVLPVAPVAFIAKLVKDIAEIRKHHIYRPSLQSLKITIGETTIGAKNSVVQD